MSSENVNGPAVCTAIGVKNNVINAINKVEGATGIALNVRKVGVLGALRLSLMRIPRIQNEYSSNTIAATRRFFIFIHSYNPRIRLLLIKLSHLINSWV